MKKKKEIYCIYKYNKKQLFIATYRLLFKFCSMIHHENYNLIPRRICDQRLGNKE